MNNLCQKVPETFFDKVSRTSILPMPAETQNFLLKWEITKCEQCTIETLINNYLIKEKAFYCLNKRFVLNITRDIIFLTRSSRKWLADACTTQNFSLRLKITKPEQCAIENLINNYLVKEKAFYGLNEWFESNITGDIFFSKRSLECFRQ